MPETPSNQSDLSLALDQLWKQYLPAIQERVDVLESTAALLTQRELTSEERAAANSAAHKLAGVLGTFGLTKGTVLAREAEILYSGDPGTDPADTANLARIAASLKSIVAGRQSPAL